MQRHSRLARPSRRRRRHEGFRFAADMRYDEKPAPPTGDSLAAALRERAVRKVRFTCPALLWLYEKDPHTHVHTHTHLSRAVRIVHSSAYPSGSVVCQSLKPRVYACQDSIHREVYCPMVDTRSSVIVVPAGRQANCRGDDNVRPFTWDLPRFPACSRAQAYNAGSMWSLSRQLGYLQYIRRGLATQLPPFGRGASSPRLRPPAEREGMLCSVAVLASDSCAVPLCRLYDAPWHLRQAISASSLSDKPGHCSTWTTTAPASWRRWAARMS